MLSELRRTIQDVRHSRRAMGVGVADQGATSALCELTNGHLIVTVFGGTAPSLDFDLSSSRYDTIGRLHQALMRVDGYRANIDEDANLQHVSLDLEPFGPTPILETGVDLLHHVFADSELEEVLRRATTRHNPSFGPASVPPQEVPFILQLAQADVCRQWAIDAAKRRGLDKDVATLLKLADAYEKAYKDDTTRHARAIQSPREANTNTTNEGDVMRGQMFRRSLRTGFMSPLSAALPPEAAVLLDIEERDIEDDNVRVLWQRNKDPAFYSYELWADTTPNVIREREGGLVSAGTPISFISGQDSIRDGAIRQTTSVMVFRSFGANAPSSRSAFSTFVEEFGQLIRAFAVAKLESQTSYYFRLYVIGLNYQAVSSNIVGATTKPLRVRFKTFDYIDRQSGAAGDTVNITFDVTKGAFTANHLLRVGGKLVTPVVFTASTAQFLIPTFENLGVKAISVESPTGLVDVRKTALTVTA